MMLTCAQRVRAINVRCFVSLHSLCLCACFVFSTPSPSPSAPCTCLLPSSFICFLHSPFALAITHAYVLPFFFSFGTDTAETDPNPTHVQPSSVYAPAQGPLVRQEGSNKPNNNQAQISTAAVLLPSKPSSPCQDPTHLPSPFFSRQGFLWTDFEATRPSPCLWQTQS